MVASLPAGNDRHLSFGRYRHRSAAGGRSSNCTRPLREALIQGTIEESTCQVRHSQPSDAPVSGFRRRGDFASKAQRLKGSEGSQPSRRRHFEAASTRPDAGRRRREDCNENGTLR